MTGCCCLPEGDVGYTGSDSKEENAVLESAWTRENKYRADLMAGLWQLALQRGVFDPANPLSGLGDGNFQDGVEDFLRIMEGLVDLARRLPVPDPNDEARIAAVVAVQLGASKVSRLQKLSGVEVMAVMNRALNLA